MTRKRQTPMQMLGSRINYYREHHGMTQQDLAVKTGLSVSTVSRLELGANPNPSLTTLMQIAKALRIHVSGLVEGM